MNPTPALGAHGRLAVSFIAASFLSLLIVGPACAAPESPGDELRVAIIVSRHGVRAPLLSPEKLAKYSSQPWPKWEVEPGIQTPRGNELVAIMGDYYRARLIREGALSGNPSQDAGLVYVRADNDQRTLETGRIIGKSLIQTGEPEIHQVPSDTADPLFRTYKAHVGKPDSTLAVAAILGRMGGDPRNVERAYARQLDELKAVLYGPAGAGPDSPFNAPSAVVHGRKNYMVDFTGPMLSALETTDALLLEYVDGKPMADVGWGRLDPKTLTDLLALHELFFDMAERTFYPAQVGASNLAGHIVDTLEQAATGEPVPGALGEPGQKVVLLVGHDSNIANLGGLFGMSWLVNGTQMNPTIPGSALLFELWKRPGPQGACYVQVSYVAQTLEQMRDASPLSIDAPPTVAPVFVPGCSGSAPGYGAPLPAFVRQARKVIDPSFIAPEQ